MIKAFIFDMDGVIIDSEPIHNQVDIQTLNQLGANVTKKDLEKYVGMVDNEKWALFKQDFNISISTDEIIDLQVAEKVRIVQESNIEPIEGIKNIIIELKKNNVLIGVASSSPIIYIKEVLKKFKLDCYFDCIICGQDVSNGKPAPDIFIKVSNMLNIDPINCLVIEDSKNGALAAKAAGMTCIGYINPNSGDQDLSSADIVVKSISDISIDKFL